MRKYTAEFIGTFFLVFTITTTVLGGFALAPLAIGGVLMVMVFAGGHISGAHYNPAVTFAAAIRGAHPWSQVLPYWGSQILGAVAAAGVGRLVVGHGPAAALTLSGRHLAVAALAEAVVTFALAYVVLNVATSKDNDGNSFYGIAIGGTVMAGAFAVGGISGGAFNPAVGFGIATAGMVSWGLVPMYAVATLAGGAAAAAVFRFVSPADVSAAAAEPVADVAPPTALPLAS